jgi:hypothetical protein
LKKFFEITGIFFFLVLVCAGLGYCICKLTGNEDLIEEFKDRIMERHTCNCGGDCSCGEEEL